MKICPTLRKVVWLGVAFGIVLPTVGWSRESVPAGYQVIAADYGIPYTVLYAIALTESAAGTNDEGVHRPWPWTLNVAGRGYFYPSREAAWTALNTFIAGGERSIDIGLMQVNWRFHQDKLGDTWLALEPYHNLRVGALILRHCFEQRRDWWAGVGCYHSPANMVRAQRYRARVVRHWRQLTANG